MYQEPLVAILLSTYNGENYIREQLDSIVAQTYSNILLYIRDDGSSDGTVSIIKEYEENYPKLIRIIEEEYKKNLGYKGGFWTLLKSVSDASYYAFCDQDDIWLSDKIEKGVLALEARSEKKALLYSSSFIYMNQNSKVIGEAPKVQLDTKLKDLLFYTPAFGFTILINKKLREIALDVECLDDIPHDGWLQKVAGAMGEFIYDSTVTAHYRRHEKTVTYSTPSKWILIKKWLKHDIFGDALGENYFIINRFYKEYSDRLGKDEKALLTIFQPTVLFSKKYFKKLFFKERLRPTWGGELALRLCFLIGK